MESSFYHWLQSHLPASESLKLGIGDDAAILASVSDSHTVVTTDMLTDGVDFLIEESTRKKWGTKPWVSI